MAFSILPPKPLGGRALATRETAVAKPRVERRRPSRTPLPDADAALVAWFAAQMAEHGWTGHDPDGDLAATVIAILRTAAGQQIAELAASTAPVIEAPTRAAIEKRSA